MNSNKTGLLCILILLSIVVDIYGQSRKSTKKKKINKSILIDLQIEKDFYNRSFFQKFDGEALTLISEVPLPDGKNILHENVVLLDNFDYIRITDRKKAFRNSILSGLVVGLASFVVVKAISKDEEQLNLKLIRQKGTNGTVEGVLAGTLGFGMGVLLYDNLFNKRMDITTQRREIANRLKKIKL